MRNIESNDLTIVRTVKRDELEFETCGAQFGFLTNDDKIQALYKFEEVKWNDGTITNEWKFLTHTQSWVFSDFNINTIKDKRFIAIVD